MFGQFGHYKDKEAKRKKTGVTKEKNWLAGWDRTRHIAFLTFVICRRNVGTMKGEEDVCIFAGVQDIANWLFSEMANLYERMSCQGQCGRVENLNWLCYSHLFAVVNDCLRQRYELRRKNISSWNYVINSSYVNKNDGTDKMLSSSPRVRGKRNKSCPSRYRSKAR